MLYYATGERAHKNKKNWSWALPHEEGGERATRKGMVAQRAGPMAVLSLTEAAMKHSSDSVSAARCHRALGAVSFHVYVWVCVLWCFSFGWGMYVLGVSFVWCFSFRSLLGKFDCMFCSE